jgi:hypothetical protein
MHVYLPDLDILSDALRSVFLDVRKRDNVAGRKTFLAGQSLGGLAVAAYGLSVLVLFRRILELKEVWSSADTRTQISLACCSDVR